MAVSDRLYTRLYMHIQYNIIIMVSLFLLRTVHGSPYTFSVKLKWRTVIFFVFPSRAPRLKRICARHPLKDTLRQGFQSAVEVPWRFGCVHARSSRTTVFNSYTNRCNIFNIYRAVRVWLDSLQYLPLLIGLLPRTWALLRPL